MESLTSSLVFVRGVDVLNVPRCLYKLLGHRSDTQHTPQDKSPEVSSQSSITDYGRHTVLHRVMSTWNSIPHQVTDASRKTDENTPYGTAGTVKRHTGTDTHTHDTTHTYTGCCTVEM
jgi:hypothetical protein